MRLAGRWARLAWFVGLYAVSLTVFAVIIYALKRVLAS
ncbi:MAG: hypothetical protein K0S06_161 [Microvirga sp.]|jgi:hypothetical protein|nr:hypothetical protein [Microvirga sp.]